VLAHPGLRIPDPQQVISPNIPKAPTIPLKVPSAHIPYFPPIVVPPSNLEAPPGVEAEPTEETPADPPKLKIPVIDIQLPLPTAEIVATATYAAVTAVAATTLATPFFDTIKKNLQKQLQAKVNKWKENRKKKETSLTESKENEENLKKNK